MQTDGQKTLGKSAQYLRRTMNNSAGQGGTSADYPSPQSSHSPTSAARIPEVFLFLSASSIVRFTHSNHTDILEANADLLSSAAGI